MRQDRTENSKVCFPKRAFEFFSSTKKPLKWSTRKLRVAMYDVYMQMTRANSLISVLITIHGRRYSVEKNSSLY